MIVAWDNSDGWYDHAFANLTSSSFDALADQMSGVGKCGTGTALAGVNGPAVNGRCGPGTRIPFLVISPWAKVNYVDHTPISQASVVRFIDDNWLRGQRIGGGSFDATAGSIMSMFVFCPLAVAPMSAPEVFSVKSTNRCQPRDSARCLRAPLAAGVLIAAMSFCAWALVYPSRVPAAVGAIVENLTGANANPIGLQRPIAPPQLSAVAQLGKKMFFDPTLSASGRQSCASCHSPAHAYGPPNSLAVQLGGPALSQQGYRPPQSLMYLYRQPNFGIGPDSGDADNAPDLAQVATQAAGVEVAQKKRGGGACRASNGPARRHVLGRPRRHAAGTGIRPDVESGRDGEYEHG
ncbi:hypothetical protein R75465_08115 [Paraburkholderia aspalathi]|nr:hypothetical protein R75465_08115 [Paraburkholderia aspalathi]